MRVHFREILPAEDDEKAPWPRLVVKESNTLIQSLKMNGQNKVGAELFYDKGNWGLREIQETTQTTVKKTYENRQKTRTSGERATSPQVSPQTKSKQSPASPLPPQ